MKSCKLCNNYLNQYDLCVNCIVRPTTNKAVVNKPILKSYSYKDFKSQIRSGDLLLCSGRTTIAQLIQQATGSPWSHVGFIIEIKSINKLMVLESVENIGVRTIPLDSYFYDHNGSGRRYNGTIVIARHSQIKEFNINDLHSDIFAKLGYPYNFDEIFRITSRIVGYLIGILAKVKPTNYSIESLINKRQYICSEFAAMCLFALGIKISYNEYGYIAPADFGLDPQIDLLGYIQ